MIQGEVLHLGSRQYMIPPSSLQPGQSNMHSVIVLTHDDVLSRPHKRLMSVLVAAIYSDNGRRRHHLVHSIPLDANDPNLSKIISWNSVVETHELFALPVAAFTDPNTKSYGKLPSPYFEDVLEGAAALILGSTGP